MRLLTTAGSSALIALLIGIMPAPASAQLGFLKKQLKKKVVETVIDTALSKVAGQAVAANQPTDSGARVTAGQSLAQAPKFDKYVVEITPQALDHLEKFLTTKQEKDPQTLVQMSLMTQRVVAFCAAAEPAGGGGAAVSALSTISGLYKAYTAAEMATLKPRCAKIAALFKSGS